MARHTHHTFSCLIKGPRGRIICKVVGEQLRCTSTGTKRAAKKIQIRTLYVSASGGAEVGSILRAGKTFASFETANRAVNADRQMLGQHGFGGFTAYFVAVWKNDDQRRFTVEVQPGRPVSRPVQQALLEKTSHEGPSFINAYSLD